MSVNLPTKHHLEFLSLKEAAQARLSLHLSKCHIVENHMSQLIMCIEQYNLYFEFFENIICIYNCWKPYLINNKDKYITRR